ncbi:IPTL-CTERM sorting domain-containing protein, partial [Rhizobium sp. P38BS-XIX]|uniref:beta strand repeat-containing protein n=1 Tax=Rhizobium sp. P38BS-XIX TaxID=2726740 RepID=UPI0014577097
MSGSYTTPQAYPDFTVYAWSQPGADEVHAAVTCQNAMGTITPPAFPTTRAGGTTSSLTMSLSLAPDNNLTITPTAPGLTFSPSTITFASGTTTQTFTVTADSAATPGPVAISYTLGGTDAADYTTPANSSMTVLGTISPPTYPSLTQGSTSAALIMTASSSGAVSVTPSATGLTFSPSTLNFSTATNVSFIVTAASNAGPGPVTVSYTLSGSGAASYVTPPTESITVNVPPPTITSVSPTAGPMAAGTSVVITGTNFTDATAVIFGGSAASSFTINSATSITATAPAGSGTVDIRVTTPGGTSAATAADQFTYVAAPTVTSLSPTAGPTAGGTSVVITGTNLSGATSVLFGASAATSFTVNSASQITATAPAGTGTVDVRVATVGGTSTTTAADQFTYLQAPVITSISPTSGPSAGGTVVTITGSNFSGASAVTFGGSAATGVTVVSGTTITATAPAGTGTVDVRVTTVGGTSAASAADQFTYIPAPTVTSASPTAGPTAGGATVTLTGTNFTGVTAVTFGGTPAASFTFNSATSITATAPAGSGTVDIRVTTPGGTSAATAADQFTYVAAPTVTSLSPTAGPTAGGTSVVITGTNLSGATSVLFGASAATSFTVNSASQITATAPAGTGTVDVRVATVGGTSATTAADQFTYLQAPVITSISPTSGPTAGGTVVTVTGAHLTGVTSVRFGASTASSITVNSDSSMTVVAPVNSAGTYDITATSGGGTSTTSAADQFTYVSAPVVSSIIPTAGPTSGGTTVMLTGTNFTDATAVTFGATPAASFSVNSPTSITATAPAGTGTIDLRVTSVGGTSATSAADQYTYIAPPTISSVTPNAGSEGGGTSVTITGSNFSGATAVTFGGTTAAGFTVNSPTSITATSPAHSGGATDVVITTLGGTGTLSGGYTFLNPPVAGNVSATVDPNSTNNPITLALSGGTAASVAVSTPASHGTATASGTSITYTPTAGYSGTDSFAYTATNATGTSTPAAVSVRISAPVVTITPASLPNATIATSYSATVSAAGGTSPYSYAVTAGSLPPGLTLSSTGEISGTPTGGGTYNFTLTATDSTTGSGAPFGGSIAYALTVNEPSMSILPGSTPNMTVGTAFSETFTASGGSAPYSYVLAAGTFPPGLTLAADGTLSGTPIMAGSFSFIIRATDSSTGTNAPYHVDTAVHTLNVNAPTLSIGPATLPAATIAASYNATVTASGGTSPYSYAVTAGSLPAGLSLNASTGAIIGSPTAGGVFNFTITATDSSIGTGAPFTVAIAYSLNVAAPTMSISPPTLPSGTIAAFYNETVTASGGSTPYSYAVSAGALPAGLTLNTSTGEIAGTPTAGGNFNFTITATDSSTGTGAPYTASRPYTLTIAAPTLSVTPSTLPGAALNVAYSQPLTASGGTSPYSYAVTAGALPQGLTLSSGGLLSGTPTSAGTFNFTVSATDS